ncbi:MAG: sulfotransferase [Proteobacteria bacterium]|nr:sulfotransferase [Pseudomonadota bacterium]
MPGNLVNNISEKTTGSKDRLWHPRFWNGITIRGFLLLMVRNRFAVAPQRLGMALILSVLVFLNLFWCVLQFVFYRRRIARTELAEDPIFVIGHWRSGTTMLHEMMVLDRRHTYPDTYNCFAPNHFLVSGWLLRPAFRWVLPARRPMDNMKAGWEKPQEDELAMCNMGIRSPYLTVAFPNRPPQNQEYFELSEVSDKELARWKRSLRWFLKCVTIQKAGRIVLKSPPHTFRVKLLLKMFPNARFVHIVRNPYALFTSTVKLWKNLYRTHGLQMPRFEGLEEYIFDVGQRMYEVFERDRNLIPPGQIAEVKYEDLVSDPFGQVQKIYKELDLGGFDEALPNLREYVAAWKDYKTNVHEISDEIQAQVDHHWGEYAKKYYGKVVS